MQASEYVKYDALGLAQLVQNKEVTPQELVDAAISKIDTDNPKLNAVVRRLDEYARQASRQELGDGPFRGVPFLVKDLFSSLANVPTSFGSKFAKDFTLDHDSEIIKRFKRAGLIIAGKTNCPEYGIMPVTEPELHGPTRNPWNLEHTPGGSSGGSASAVAAGFVPAAHGGDGGGSIRIPASCCGLFGFKPTEGSSPTGPEFGRQWQGLALEHALTRSVRDSAALLDAINERPNSESHLSQVGKEPGKLKIALITEPFFKANLHPDCLKAVNDAAKLCEELGHHVEETDLQINRRQLTYSFLIMIAAETAAAIDYFSDKFGRKPKRNELEALTHVTCRGGNYFKAKDLAKAIQEFDAARRVMAEFYQKYDIILSPTLAKPPVKVGELNKRPFAERFALGVLSRFSIGPMIKMAFETMPDSAFAFTPFTPLFNITGQPAMSVPLHWNSAGLPIGLQFAAKYGNDAKLFQLAGQLEQARPWKDRHPPAVA